MTAPTLLAGLDQALDRLRTAAAGRSWEPVYFSAFETLNWAASLDDYLGRPRTGNADTDDHLNAFRFARNRVHHQWADAFELDLGVTAILGLARLGRMQLGRTHAALPWRTATDLPVPSDPEFRNPKGEAAYRRVFEGREVLPTMEVVARALRAAAAKDHPGTPGPLLPFHTSLTP